jgi:minor extracellular serine protease Vpr
MRISRMRFGWALALAALVVAVPAALGGSASTGSVPAAAAENTNLWFVELDGTPASFRSKAKEAGIDYSERFAFTKLWNGVSIKVDGREINAVKQLSGVKAVYPVASVELDPIANDSPEMKTALAMTGADNAQTELGFSGQGIKVAVMDTGVDYDHADLGGDGVSRTNSPVFPTARVTHGHDFVGDDFNADSSSASYNPVTTPDPYPDDCNGHGTHVSGIVGASPAAEGGVLGVAPDVTFGSYRVFGCEGSTTADIMIAAMERAQADGMDILNMSIGSAFQTWPQYPTAAAADALVDEGMVVVASIGNSGASGVYSASAPGVGRNVIGVASFDNTHVELPTFTITPDGQQIGYANATAAPPAPTSGTLPMARTGTPTSTADGCSALPAGSMSGKAVLIRRGTCSFHAKALNAQNAGAAAVVLYNNAPGRVNPTVAGSPAITIPVVAISDQEGVLINNRLAAGPVDMTWTDENGTFENPSGGLISSFSSFGLTAELDVKPDLGAPGGLIRSTWPLENGSYATISGTSMASPHVAGAAALLMEARPSLPVADFRTVLQNSADPKNWNGNPGLGFLDNVHRQGAGMLDIDDSILATTTVRPGKLALGESETGPAVRTLTISNSGSASVTYDLSHAQALATGGSTNAPSQLASFATVVFSAPSVVVPAGGVATVTATITAPATALRQYGGYLVLTPQGGGQRYRVPYAGLSGDYQSIQVLTPTANGFPWLAKLQGNSFFNQPNGGTFTMAGEDVAYFLVHFEHQARQFKMELLHPDGTPKGGKHSTFFVADYLPRNSTASGFFVFTWDGTMRISQKKGFHFAPQPDGDYKVKLSVLKALGDAANPAHSETWTSPTITIDRP